LLNTHFTFTYYIGIMFQLLLDTHFIGFYLYIRIIISIQKIVTKISKIIKLKNDFFIINNYLNLKYKN